MSEQPDGDHPDHDLLSDYAAQVVQTPQLAARVEEHVLGCSDCAQLLADAEGVRTALRTLPPEPIPADVMSGIGAALARAAAQPAEDDAASTGPSTGLVPVQPDRPARLLRPTLTTLPGGLRRQARQEDRAPRIDVRRLVPPPRWVAAAAAVLVLGVAGLGIVRAVRPDPETTAASSADAGSSEAAAPVVVQVRATGTDYRPDRLKAQVQALLGAADSGGLTEAQERKAAAVPTATGTADQLASGLGAASSTRLTDPAALRECLVAIGEPDGQPVAVDLARYRGQDAAVIVLQNEGGTYDVWAVSRDCRPDADGTIDVRTVTP